jgi:hypothetical protein
MSASKSHRTRYPTLPTHGYYKIKVMILLWVDFFVPYDKRKNLAILCFTLTLDCFFRLQRIDIFAS